LKVGARGQGPPDRHLAAGVDGVWPRGDCPLPRSTRAWASVAARRGSWAGPACASGPKGRGATCFQIKFDFSFSFMQNSPKNPILSTKIPFSKGDPKIKVVHDFVFYSFVKRSKVKFQRILNYRFKVNLNQKPYFGRLFLKEKFEKTLNIHFAPNCLPNISKLFRRSNKVQTWQNEHQHGI
jgi:hypothetical protein